MTLCIVAFYIYIYVCLYSSKRMHRCCLYVMEKEGEYAHLFNILEFIESMDFEQGKRLLYQSSFF
jgi:hypothetical protein